MDERIPITESLQQDGCYKQLQQKAQLTISLSSLQPSCCQISLVSSYIMGRYGQCLLLLSCVSVWFACSQCKQFGAGLKSAIHAARLCCGHVSEQKQPKGLLALEPSHRHWEPYDLQAACGYHSGISRIGSLSAAETVCMVQMTFCCLSRPQHYSPTWTSGLTQICTH